MTVTPIRTETARSSLGVGDSFGLPLPLADLRAALSLTSGFTLVLLLSSFRPNLASALALRSRSSRSLLLSLAALYFLLSASLSTFTP
jgi:hypothetical protein